MYHSHDEFLYDANQKKLKDHNAIYSAKEIELLWKGLSYIIS